MIPAMPILNRAHTRGILLFVCCSILSFSPVYAQILFAPGGTNALGVSSNGNVGIGTSDPLALLTIHSTNPYMGLNSGSTGKQSGVIFYDNSASQWMIGNNYNNAGDGNLFFVRSGPFGNLVLLPDGNGKVGVGTVSPLTLFTVESPSNPYIGINASTVGKQSGVLFYDHSEPRWQIGNNYNNAGDGNLFFGRMGAFGDLLLLPDAQGKVGIGTTTPLTLLTVASPSNPYIGLSSSTPGKQNGVLFYESSDLLWQLGCHYNNAGDGNFFIVRAGGSGNLVLLPDSAGNVGIGTTSPSHKLAVNGTIKAKEVIVETTGWSDHVFANDYRLAPLSEVEQHIQQNGHLPDVPSAADVAARGVSVGEMQKILLQKIEELTLHVIRLEKENASLRADITSLKKQPLP